MSSLRTYLVWAAVAVAAALIAMCAYGAWIGAEAAKAFFHSPPLVAFWLVLLVLLAASLILSPTLYRRPAGMAMHVGALLLLAGAMIGSGEGHELARRWFGNERFANGKMQVVRDTPTDVVYTRVSRDGFQKNRLPFSLRLLDVRALYYPAGPWELWAARPSESEEGMNEAKRIDWREGREVAVPFTSTRLTVVKYLPAARPIYAGGAPYTLIARPPHGRPVSVPGKAGSEANLASPALTIRVVRVFERLRVIADPNGRVLADADEGPANPAAEIEVADSGGETSRRVVTMLEGMPPAPVEGVEFEYLPSSPVDAEADANFGSPAIQVALRREGGKSVQRWLAPTPQVPAAGLRLVAALGPSGRRSDDQTSIWLMRPAPQVRQYESDVAVEVDGREVHRQTISINHPMNYGGYDFAMLSYDEKALRYSVLDVHSDKGLIWVYAGMGLLCAGMFGYCWVLPAVRRLRKREARGD